MRRVIILLTLFCLCACNGNNTSLPNKAYNVQLGEAYTESQMIQSLNKDTFRNFRVWHNGDSFMPGMYDTFYKTVENDHISYSGNKSTNSTDFSFLDCKWTKFSIDTDLSGRVERLSFSKGTTFSNYPLDMIMKDCNTLIINLHNLYGESEDSDVDGKRISIWKDSSTCLTVEYWEFEDYKNDNNAILSCVISLKEE